MRDAKPFFRCLITFQRTSVGTVDLYITQRDGGLHVLRDVPDLPQHLSGIEAWQDEGSDIVNIRIPDQDEGSAFPPALSA